MAKRKQLKNRNEILSRDKDKCMKCGREDSLEIHHIIAVIDGGKDDLDNLLTLCAACHSEWHTIEMVSTIPFHEWLKIPCLLMLIALYQIKPNKENIEFYDVKNAIVSADMIRRPHYYSKEYGASINPLKIID